MRDPAGKKSARVREREETNDVQEYIMQLALR